MKTIFPVSIIFAASALVGAAVAVTYYVPDDYGTIQAALDYVPAGNTIIVRDDIHMGQDNRDTESGSDVRRARS